MLPSDLASKSREWLIERALLLAGRLECIERAKRPLGFAGYHIPPGQRVTLAALADCACKPFDLRLNDDALIVERIRCGCIDLITKAASSRAFNLAIDPNLNVAMVCQRATAFSITLHNPMFAETVFALPTMWVLTA